MDRSDTSALPYETLPNKLAAIDPIMPPANLLLAARIWAILSCFSVDHYHMADKMDDKDAAKTSTFENSPLSGSWPDASGHIKHF